MKKTTVFSLAIMVALVALAIPAIGQEKQRAEQTASEEQTSPPKAAREELLRKVIQLKYADPEAVSHLVALFGASIVPDRRMKVLTVVGPAPAVAAIEEAVKKLDVPPPPSKEVELTAYFLVATRQPSEGPDLPPELHDVISQLKRVVNYQSFRLLNTALIRTRDKEGASVSGTVGGGVTNLTGNFRLRFDRLNIIAEEKAPIVRIEGLIFQVRGPEAVREGNMLRTGEAPEAGIQTNIDVPEGQKVVVGKTAFQSADDAFVLVVTARIVE